MSKKIVIASTLKPVDDVRAYWKIAQSLAKTNKYEVNIIGNSGKKEPADEKIKFHPHHIHRSQFLKRLLLRYQILLKVLRISPSILIITTHELLFVAFVIRLFHRMKIVYDVQENYKMNASLHGLPGMVIGSMIRIKEIVLTSVVAQCWLAEEAYIRELSFGKNGVLFENKAIAYPMPDRKVDHIKVLFSGTLSDYAGVRRALNFMVSMQTEHRQLEGYIVGQVHDPKLEHWLQENCQANEKIELHLSKDPVPYEEILERMKWANLGIVGYAPNQVNRHKMPTKCFEYSRYQIPFVVEEETTWAQRGLELGGAIPINFETPDWSFIFQQWQNQSQLFNSNYPVDATWESEEAKILDSIEALLH